LRVSYRHVVLRRRRLRLAQFVAAGLDEVGAVAPLAAVAALVHLVVGGEAPVEERLLVDDAVRLRGWSR
jgi:hypothetical protein